MSVPSVAVNMALQHIDLDSRRAMFALWSYTTRNTAIGYLYVNWIPRLSSKPGSYHVEWWFAAFRGRACLGTACLECIWSLWQMLTLVEGRLVRIVKTHCSWRWALSVLTQWRNTFHGLANYEPATNRSFGRGGKQWNFFANCSERSHWTS